jgi:hypothetical protein
MALTLSTGISVPATSTATTLITGTRAQLGALRDALDRALDEGPPEEPWTVDALGWNGSERLAIAVASDAPPVA